MEKLESLIERHHLVAHELEFVIRTGRGEYGDDEPVDVTQLNRVWNEFISQGGVTADDLRRFLAGEDLATGSTIKRKHLRLVRCQPIRPLILQNQGGPEAA
jgi:hypothetical protein